MDAFLDSWLLYFSYNINFYNATKEKLGDVLQFFFFL